jgi:hypothetical protein
MVGNATRYLQPVFERQHYAQVAFDNASDAADSAAVSRQRLLTLKELRLRGYWV